MNDTQHVMSSKGIRRHAGLGSTGPQLSWAAAGRILVLLAISGVCALAVDPLPPELEKAPPEVQTEYIEKMARASHEQKTQVARRRYAERMQLKQAIHQRMIAEVRARQNQLTNAPEASPGLVAQVMTPRRSGFGIGLAVLGLIAGGLLVLRGWRAPST